MAAAARVHLVERGKDPRQYAMVGFGGAGPAHAVDVARAMGIARVLVPARLGRRLGAGLPRRAAVVRRRALAADRADAAASTPTRSTPSSPRWKRKAAAPSDPRRRRPPRDAMVERSADMRLVGQMHDISVPLPGRRRSPRPTCRRSATAFVRRLFRTLRRALRRRPLRGGELPLPRRRPDPGTVADRRRRRRRCRAKVKSTRRCHFDEGAFETKVYDRYALRPGDAIAGPAIIEEREATTVIGPADRVTVDDSLTLCIDYRRTGGARGADHRRHAARRRRWRGSTPIRSGWRSCGRGWSTWSRRCG